MSSSALIIRQLGLRHWLSVSKAMHDFTRLRQADTPDELWLVEHFPIFTQGQAGKAEHLLDTGDIPVMQSDRGGQVTYHGPGQQIMYVMINLRRHHLSVRQLVSALEQSVINTLEHFGVIAYSLAKAPGVYVDNQKICSLGLRIRQGCSFHGLALNVNNDLSPFTRINPCGYAGLKMTRLSDYQPAITPSDVQQVLIDHFTSLLAITNIHYAGNNEHLPITSFSSADDDSSFR